MKFFLYKTQNTFSMLFQCLSRQEILNLLHRFSQNVMNFNDGKKMAVLLIICLLWKAIFVH